MAENRPENDGSEKERTDMLINNGGSTRDGVVVVDEPERTVLLAGDEALVVEKQPEIPIAPKGRPRKVYSGMWGTPELVALGIALSSLLAAIVFYLVWVAPSASELEASRSEARRLEAELASARANFGNITNVETHVSKLLASIDDFEAYLPLSVNGRTAIYQRLNGLIYAYGLVNTSGPAYSPLEPADVAQQNQSEDERGRSRFRSLFPGVYVTMTVEGPYQNLRRFIREIETGNEFVVISSVELAPSESTIGTTTEPTPPPQNDVQQMFDPTLRSVPMSPGPGMPGSPQQAPTPQRGRTLGERVALRLELAAYFRRQDLVPTADPTAEPQIR